MPPAYLKKHMDSVENFVITTCDCLMVFRTVQYDGADEALCEKWKLVGQCLSRVCSKWCSWSKLEEQAAASNVCNFTTVAEEAIVYWIFVMEGEGWLKEAKGVQGNDSDEEDGTNSGITNTSACKKCGQHKTVTHLDHWRQLFGLVKTKCENRSISESWDNAWMTFVAEELEYKKNKKMTRKRKVKEVLPKFEDVLGVGSAAIECASVYELVISDATSLGFCTQRELV
jgi:hypothetical protein